MKINIDNKYKNNKVKPLLDKITESNQLIVYLIVRESLSMSAGKIGAQCGHAVQYLLTKHFNSINDDESYFNSRMKAWINSNAHTKIVLKASDKEWIKLMEEYDFIYVVDMGKTEIETGSETVGILYPLFKDERFKTLKRLQLL